MIRFSSHLAIKNHIHKEASKSTKDRKYCNRNLYFSVRIHHRSPLGKSLLGDGDIKPETKWPPNEIWKQSYRGFIWRKLVFSKTYVNIMIKSIDISSNQSKHEILQSFFHSIGKKHFAKMLLLNSYLSKQSAIDTHQHPLFTDEKVPSSFLSEIYLTSQDVRDASSCIDYCKASGSDLISPKLIKGGKEERALPLSQIILTNCWQTQNPLIPGNWLTSIQFLKPNLTLQTPAIIDQYHF